MGTDLAAFLARCSPQVSEPVVWPGMRFQTTAYLSDTTPPLPHVTSVRTVVVHDGMVLVQEDRERRHIIPGGRCEGDESAEATLRREVREETGWSLGTVERLGFWHFRHLEPKPDGYAYPYPEFVQLVYAAEACTYDPEAKLDDAFEVGTEFLLPADVRQLSLSRAERVYLEAALRR